MQNSKDELNGEQCSTADGVCDLGARPAESVHIHAPQHAPQRRAEGAGRGQGRGGGGQHTCTCCSQERGSRAAGKAPLLSPLAGFSDMASSLL